MNLIKNLKKSTNFKETTYEGLGKIQSIINSITFGIYPVVNQIRCFCMDSRENPRSTVANFT